MKPIALCAGVIFFSFVVTAATFTVTNNLDSGAGSLRQAILDANTNTGPDTITFNIPGTNVHTISFSSFGMLVSDPVTIDGTTQPGYAGMPLIDVNGGFGDGLLITAGHSTVRALVIRNCGGSSNPGSGIVLSNAGGNVIQGCFIGTGPAGTNSGFQKENYLDGIRIDNSPNNLIGGTNASDRNLIFGNRAGGIEILGAGASNNVVQGNLIGLDITGTIAWGSGQGSPNVIISNAPKNTIGGVIPGARNVIAGNSSKGVWITGIGATANQVQGNFIGSDVTGTNPLGNYASGIWVASGFNNLIGGPLNSGAGNIIGWNGQAGGYDPGVYLYFANNNLVQGNTIVANNGPGVAFIGGNIISENSFADNSGLPIDRGFDGPTGNVPNGPSNYPILTSARQGSAIMGSTTIKGTFNGAANCTYEIQFRSSQHSESARRTSCRQDYCHDGQLG